MLRLLLVDDDSTALADLARWSAEDQFELTHAGTADEARQLLESNEFDVALVADLVDGSGLDLVAELDSPHHPQTMVLADSKTVAGVVDSMRHGAIDYMTRPLDHAALRRSLKHAEHRAQLRQSVRALRTELRGLGNLEGIVGSSPPMQKVFELVEQVAPTSASVLIVGETGTGKELVARAVHRLSRRADREFVALNCGAVPESLIESELFGHEKGAFTGATQRRRGLFERADRGTLLLDEITEMPLELQPNLLRVLETGMFRPVGSEQPRRADVRILASTNRDPLTAVRDGFLREDLLYRLNVFPLELPPLRDREGDVEQIARHVLHQLNQQNGAQKRLAPRAVEQLERHDWPGNVRELINAMRRAYILSDGRIERLELGSSVDAGPEPSRERDIDAFVGSSIADMERELILATLKAHGGNKKKTARILGISLKTLYTRLNRYGEEAEEVIREARERAAES